MDGSIPLVVLMVDEELPVNLSQERVFLQFLENGDYEVPSV